VGIGAGDVRLSQATQPLANTFLYEVWLCMHL